MTNIDFTPDELRAILSEYSYDPNDIMTEDDERVLAIKEALSKLPQADVIIFGLYLEVGSSRKLGKMLGGVSHSSILKEVARIKQDILDLITNRK